MIAASAATARAPAWKPLLAVVLCLCLSAFVLRAREEAYARRAAASAAQLDDALGAFSEKKVVDLRAAVSSSAVRLAALGALFDPRAKWTRSNYDMSILFAEELNRSSTELKALADSRQTDFSGFSFTDKLPSESDAALLLGQLYAMRSVAELAVASGADVSLAKPLPPTKESALPDTREVPAEMELAFPHATVMDFLIRMNGIVPKLCSQALKVRVEPESVYVSLKYSTLSVSLSDIQGIDGKITVAQVPDESYPAGIDTAVSLLRSKSPFLIPVKQTGVEEDVTQPPEEEKPAQRFFYKGRALLRTKQVAVIEDAMRKETLFLSVGDRFDNFRLKNFSETEVILEGSDNFLTVIKREDE
jgi:hypothetical protein